MLQTPVEYVEGDVDVGGITEAMAVWQGLVQGVSAAYYLAEGELVTINILSNYELIVTQGRREWRVKRHNGRLPQTMFLRRTLGEVYFEHVTTNELLKHCTNSSGA